MGPIEFKGAFLYLPSLELAKKEGRVFFLALSPEQLIQNKNITLEVWEIKSNDERVFEEWGDVLRLLYISYLWRYMKEFYLMGYNRVEDFWEVRDKIDLEILDDPVWKRVWEMLVEKSTDLDWWKKLEGVFDELKTKGEDELLVRGVKVADMVFKQTIEGEYEECVSVVDSFMLSRWREMEIEIGEDGLDWVTTMQRTHRILRFYTTKNTKALFK